jgi:molybdate transport system ATP-binding protein
MLAFDRVQLPLAHFDLDVTFETNEKSTGIFGPSGAGKTTILELIAGIRQPVAGAITIDGVLVNEIPARLRRVGYVPQGDSLFPHMSAGENVRYGLRADVPESFVAHVVEVLEIRQLLERGTSSLSGGEVKRVALARALVTSPRLLLLDEPLAGLDRPLHGRVLDFLIRVRDEFNVPMVYVTHDPVELERMVSRAIVIENGRVIASR